MTLQEHEVQNVLAAYPGSPIAQNADARYQWARWRAILDRIVSNPHYRYDDPQKYPLLSMAAFAASMMAHYNYLTYKG